MKNAKLASASQSQADALEDRLIEFAVRIVNLSANLPRTPAGRHIANQILRSWNFAGTKLRRGEGRRKPC